MFKPLEAIRRPLVTSLVLNAFLGLCYLVLSGLVYIAYLSIPSAQSWINTSLPLEDALGWVVIPRLLVEFATIILFFIWLYRATLNLRTFTDHKMRQKPGWAVGWYFVPIASLWKPYESMTDIQAASGATESRLIVGIWWALFWIQNIASRAVPELSDSATVGVFVAQAIPDMLATLASIVFTLVTLLLVSRISRAYAVNVVEWGVRPPAIGAGWYNDPSGRHQQRYWDGKRWTDLVVGAGEAVEPEQ